MVEETAAEFLERVRAAVLGRRALELEAAELAEGHRPPRVSKGPGPSRAVSDPVYSAVVSRAAAIAANKARMSETCELVAEGFELVAGVRGYFGCDRGGRCLYADVLKRYYIDAAEKWSDVWEGLGVSRSWGCEVKAIALDYIDAVGISRAKHSATP